MIAGADGFNANEEFHDNKLTMSKIIDHGRLAISELNVGIGKYKISLFFRMVFSLISEVAFSPHVPFVRIFIACITSFSSSFRYLNRRINPDLVIIIVCDIRMVATYTFNYEISSVMWDNFW